MKRNLLILLAVLLIASVTLGAGGNGVRLNGTIEAIDDAAQTIVVNSVTVQVTRKTTICEYYDGVTCTPITFADLDVGERVGVTGQYSGTILVAKKIVVH